MNTHFFIIVSFKDTQLYGEIMKIAISSPAGKVDKKRISQGISFLKSRGFDIVVGETVGSEEYWTAGTAELRASELQAFWCDETVDVIWAARGGFGCAHLLNLLDWPVMESHSKVLCGHSDLSVLHLAFLAKGLRRTVSSAMPAVEFVEPEVDDLTLNTTFDLLKSAENVERDSFRNCRVVKEGDVRGALIPVTLSVLCSLMGTPYLPDFKGAVLVLEDVNEAPYRIDAYLNQLRLSGVLQEVGALVLGDFKNCGSGEELDYIFKKYSKYVSGPVLCELPFGHCLPRLSLPVGAELSLSAVKNRILL